MTLITLIFRLGNLFEKWEPSSAGSTAERLGPDGREFESRFVHASFIEKIKGATRTTHYHACDMSVSNRTCSTSVLIRDRQENA